LKYLFIPIVNLIPGMNQTPETAARRYLQASEFGTDVSGQFFASLKGKFSGPIEAQRHPHLHDRGQPRSRVGRPSSRSPASISLPQQLESGVLKESPIAAELIPVTRISRRLRSYMVVHGVFRYFEINGSQMP